MTKSESCQDVLLRLENVCKSFESEEVLKSINLYIKDKAFVTLLGPSGCGKTTILRLIAGFETPSSGTIYFGDTPINDVPPHKRPVNTVFQRYALFPHLNVFENVAFGLRIKKLPEDEIKQKVKKMLAMVDLKGYERRSVSKLSGGQQQRVAIARALVNMPKLLLLDEPLGALDLKLRKDMQIELKNIHKQADITFLYVTHDQEEALTMSDIIVVMKSGTIQQIGTPQDIYNEPANAFVADFIGESNILDAVMDTDYKVKVCGAEFDCTDKMPSRLVDMVVRPEDIDITAPEKGTIQGIVETCVFKGVHYEMTVDCMGKKWIVSSTTSSEVGQHVGMNIAPDNIHIMKRMFPDEVNYIEAVTVSPTDEEGNTIVLIDGIKYSVKTENTYGSDEKILLAVDPEDIDVVPQGDGSFDGYLDSVIWKSAHYELIVITENRRWLIKSPMDEQAGTNISINLKSENIREVKGVRS